MAGTGRSLRTSRAVAGAALCLLLGCARLPALGETGHVWFAPPAADDPWSPRIARWQARERAKPVAEVLSGPSGVAAGPETSGGTGEERLREKFLRFRAEHRRAIARELATWLQEQAKIHYIPDGAVDRWATLAETLARDGDDCDGLELLSF